MTGPLASVFDLSLTLRSSSPRLVLYQQLAEESLSSFPLSDDINPSPGGKCCWVDTGGALFFDVPELLLWLRDPHK